MTVSSVLDRRVGVDAVQITLGGAVVPTGLTTGYRISQGRPSPTAAPAPGVCVLQLRTDALPALPRIGDPLQIELGDDALAWAQLDTPDELAAARVRFAGHVTDLDVRPGRPVDAPGLLTVTASTATARLGRTYVGDAPWPAELDGARAARILELAAAPAGLQLGLHDAGTVTVLARDVDRQPAQQLLDELMRDTLGTLVELRDGTLVWHDAAHRQGVTSSCELTSANLLADGSGAQQRLAGIVNDVRLGYGPTLPDNSVATVDQVDTTSRARFGPFTVQQRTVLAELVDAYELAYRVVGTRSVPRWDQPGLTVELLSGGGTVSPEQRSQLLQLQLGDLVRVSGMPASGPLRRARLWVEGWTETVTRTSWQLQLVAGDYGRGGPAPRWADVDSSLTWADVDPDVTWWAAVGWDFGEDNPGRWLDLPARQRWDQLDPALTWADLAPEAP